MHLAGIRARFRPVFPTEPETLVSTDVASGGEDQVLAPSDVRHKGNRKCLTGFINSTRTN